VVVDMKETTAHTGAGDTPALRVRHSTAAAATWLVMARYSDTVGISQRYTPRGQLYIYIYILWGQGQGWWHMSCGGIACGYRYWVLGACGGCS